MPKKPDFDKELERGKVMKQRLERLQKDCAVSVSNKVATGMLGIPETDLSNDCNDPVSTSFAESKVTKNKVSSILENKENNNEITLDKANKKGSKIKKKTRRSSRGSNLSLENEARRRSSANQLIAKLKGSMDVSQSTNKQLDYNFRSLSNVSKNSPVRGRSAPNFLTNPIKVNRAYKMEIVDDLKNKTDEMGEDYEGMMMVNFKDDTLSSKAKSMIDEIQNTRKKSMTSEAMGTKDRYRSPYLYNDDDDDDDSDTDTDSDSDSSSSGSDANSSNEKIIHENQVQLLEESKEPKEDNDTEGEAELELNYNSKGIKDIDATRLSALKRNIDISRSNASQNYNLPGYENLEGDVTSHGEDADEKMDYDTHIDKEAEAELESNGASYHVSVDELRKSLNNKSLEKEENVDRPKNMVPIKSESMTKEKISPNRMKEKLPISSDARKQRKNPENYKIETFKKVSNNTTKEASRIKKVESDQMIENLNNCSLEELENHNNTKEQLMNSLIKEQISVLDGNDLPVMSPISIQMEKHNVSQTERISNQNPSIENIATIDSSSNNNNDDNNTSNSIVNNSSNNNNTELDKCANENDQDEDANYILNLEQQIMKKHKQLLGIGIELEPLPSSWSSE